MFTGIVEEVGEIAARGAPRRRARGRAIARARSGRADARARSIAVNGCCLTAVESDADGFTCELTPETLDADGVRASGCVRGAVVNLERPMRADGRFDGHIVQGPRGRRRREIVRRCSARARPRR